MQNAAEQVKNALKTSSIVSQKVQLQAKGNGEFTGLCPFHPEKTPSFTVNDNKQFFHCFGCAEHGDIFTFLMKTEGLSYKETLERLASTAGVTLPKVSYNDNERQKKFEKFYEIYKTTAEYFHKNLMDENNKTAQKYFASRGIDRKIAAKFLLGFCPANTNELFDLLKSKGFSEADILESKIIIKNDNGTLYTLFRNRVTFTIFNLKGSPIAFGGRILGDEKGPKYINSSDNPIFHKGRELYNLNNARAEGFKQNDIIVVEGYMDVISLAKHGFINSVAPLGTALRLDQIKLIWNYIDNITICLDGDNAGTKAMYKIALECLPFITSQKSLRFINLNGAKDPDEFLKKNSAAKFKEAIENSIPLANFIFKCESQKTPLKTPEQKTDLQNRLNGLADKISDDNLKKNYKYHFKSLFFDLLKSFSKRDFRATAENKAHLAKVMQTNSMKTLDIQVLWIFLKHYEKLHDDHNIINELHNLQFESKELDKIHQKLLSLYEHSEGLRDKEEIEKLASEFSISPEIKSYASCLHNVELISENDDNSLTPESLFYRLLKLKSLEALKHDIESATNDALVNKDEQAFLRLAELKN